MTYTVYADTPEEFRRQAVLWLEQCARDTYKRADVKGITKKAKAVECGAAVAISVAASFIKKIKIEPEANHPAVGKITSGPLPKENRA